MFLAHFLLISAHVKEDLYHYTISRNGKNIGKMKLVCKAEGSDLHFTIQSNVETRLISTLNIGTFDQAHFRNNTLLYSQVIHTVNGKEKDYVKTQLVGKQYSLDSGSNSKIKQLNQLITYNMIMMYVKEPVDIKTVYSDKFQEFVKINKIGSHLYRLNLPDGNYNDYYFHGGICSQVSIYRSLYTIKITLNKH